MLDSTPERTTSLVLVVVGHFCPKVPAPGVNDKEQPSVPGLVYLNKVVTRLPKNRCCELLGQD